MNMNLIKEIEYEVVKAFVKQEEVRKTSKFLIIKAGDFSYSVDVDLPKDIMKNYKSMYFNFNQTDTDLFVSLTQRAIDINSVPYTKSDSGERLSWQFNVSFPDTLIFQLFNENPFVREDKDFDLIIGRYTKHQSKVNT